jgi:hypothetical protein
LPLSPLHEAEHIGDRYTGQPAVEQLLDGQPKAPVIHRDHDLIDVVFEHEVAQRFAGIDTQAGRHHGHAALGRDVPDDIVVAQVLAYTDVLHLGGLLPRAIDQHPPSKAFTAQHKHEQQSGSRQQRQRDTDRDHHCSPPETQGPGEVHEHGDDQRAEDQSNDHARNDRGRPGIEPAVVEAHGDQRTEHHTREHQPLGPPYLDSRIQCLGLDADLQQVREVHG